MEWGGASVRPRAEIFMRGGGSLLAGLSSVCLSVCLSVCPPKTLENSGFLSTKNRSFCPVARQKCEFGSAKKYASCAAPKLVKDNFFSPSAHVCAAEWRILARGTLLLFYAQNRPKRGYPPWLGPTDRALFAANDAKDAHRKSPRAPSRPVRRLEK